MSPLSANLKPIIGKRIDPRLSQLLYSAGELADRLAWKAYCVGGSVRDLLLGRGNFDLDILVEEHGLEFAQKFAQKENGFCKLYRRFATAMVILPGGIKVDITTTRSEQYPEPGSLPEILPGSLREDLFRRDFTINALAFSINYETFGQLIDLYGGKNDLKNRVIRVLHPQSFRDDPTRVFRAIRFQQRLGFAIEPRTQKLMKTMVNLKIFEKVSPERLRHELELILEEADPAGAIEAMAKYDELRFIHPRLSFSREQKRVLHQLYQDWHWFRDTFSEEEISKWKLYFGALLWPLSVADLKQTGEKFSLSRRFLGQLLKAREEEPALHRILSSPRKVLPSQVVPALRSRGGEVVLLLMSRSTSERMRRRIERYLSVYRKVSCEIGGEELKALGLPPGPQYKRILERVLIARLDGQVTSRADELKLARRLIDKQQNA